MPLQRNCMVELQGPPYGHYADSKLQHLPVSTQACSVLGGTPYSPGFNRRLLCGKNVWRL